MKVIISGGAKNGKSSYAQKLAVEMSGGHKPLYYIATMIPTDEEDERRIARHREDREGLSFTTLEKGRDIRELLDREEVDPEGVFLLDSLTALLSNVMFPPGGDFDAEAPEKVKGDIRDFNGKAKNVIFVSDYIYSDARIFDEWTEAYREGLARIDRALSEICEGVVEVSAGLVKWHKGSEALAHE